jgi:quercetin dioxygenase-like cupin family protein
MPEILLRSEESDGVVSLVVNTVPADWPGPHLHKHDFDEAFYVLEGELTFQVEDAVITKRAGELAFAPRNVPHTLANHSDAPARYALVCTPAGFERYFARMNDDPPEWAQQEIPFEVERVGPQIGQS